MVDDIVTIVIAIISSLGAVALSAFLTHNFSGREERRRSRSLVATCLESYYLQSPEIETYFSLLSGSSLSWTKETLPVLFGWSDHTKPYDIPFDKIRENILNLDYDLANTVIRFQLQIRDINFFVTEATRDFSYQSKTDHGEMLKDLDAHRSMYKAISENVKLLSAVASNTRRQLFRGRKKVRVDWSSVDAKFNEIQKLLLEAAGDSVN